MINFGSVCSGIEAASVAWHPMGWRATWLAEIESGPATILAHRYPTTPNLGDMTRIASLVDSGAVAAPDVLVGGTPCQAFSVAGLRGGLSDARGQLSISFVELANAIDRKRSERGERECVVVWENVPGVLSSTDNAFGCFLAALAGEDVEVQPPGGKWSDAGCVFGPQRTIAWRVLDAQYFGVAQRRRRVFVIASGRTDFDTPAVLFEFDGVRRDSASSARQGHNESQAGFNTQCCWWDGGQISQTLDAVLYKKQAMPEKNRFPAVIVDGKARFITPIEAERLQGFPDDYTLVPVGNKMMADTPRYKALGNSMAVPVMQWIGERINAEYLRKGK